MTRKILVAGLSTAATLLSTTTAAVQAAPYPHGPTLAVSVTQTSSNLAQRMSPRPALRFSPLGRRPGIPVIDVNDSVRYQRFTGVGGAMTDSSAWLIWDELSPPQRNALLWALFSTAGAHLSFLRVPMGASDYSVAGVPYSYDDQPAGQSDPTLADFSVAHDEAYILPALRQALALNPALYLEAVPWSPPAWMKANDALNNAGHAGSLLPPDYPTLAQYFVKFLQAYAGQGVTINAIAPQNEPGVATEYPGMQWDQAQEASFVSNYLTPALAGAGLTPSVFGWDLSWGRLSPSDPTVSLAASGGLRGVAWHCYFGSPHYMATVQKVVPGAEQIVDECSTGTLDLLPTSEVLLESLRNDADAVGMWNLALDPSGGPVQPPNSGCAGCTGVATVNEQTGSYTLTKDFYQLAQLSHFVSPNAVRVASRHLVSYDLTSSDQIRVTPGLDDVAFQNPDGSQVLMAYNNARVPIRFAVEWRDSYVNYTIPAGSTATLVWR